MITEVICIYQGKRILFRIDQKKIKRGSILYISKNKDKEEYNVSLMPDSNFWEVYVDSIIRSDAIYVFLKERPEIDNWRIDAAKEIFRDIITEETLLAIVKNLSLQLPINKLYKTNELKDSDYNKFINVIDRLSLYNYNKKNAPNINSLYKIEDIYPGSQIWGLNIYLMLTCFDLLGQKSNYLEFGEWVNKLSERDIIKFADSEKYYKSIIKKVYEIFLINYGNKRSFFSFINNILTVSAKANLLNSLIIQINDYNEGNYSGQILANENEKIKYLYNLRNDFTHSSEILYGHYGWDEILNRPNPFIPPEKRPTHIQLKNIAMENKIKIIKVKDWPEIFYDTVKIGAVEYFKKYI